MSKNKRMNLPNKRLKFPNRVQRAIKDCEKYTRPMKNNRQIILARYASGYYSPMDYAQQLYALNNKARPINMVFRYITILMPYLAQYMPKTRVDPKGNSNYQQTADMLGLAMTHLKKEIKYRKTFREVVLNALMYIGAVKTGMCPGGEIEWGGETHQSGQVYVDSIDPDDLIFDVGARRESDMLFIGNKYRLPMQYIRDSGLYKNYDHIKKATKVHGNESPERIAKSEVSDEQYHELYDMAEVYDVYMVNEGVLLTLPIEGEGDKFMRRVEYLPEGGPYELLSFHQFPGSVLPIPPAFNALDLDEAINRLARRLDRQVKGQKTILAYEGGAKDDAERVAGAEDGSTVKVADVNRLKEVTFGTPQQDSIMAAEWFIKQFSEQQGNLNTLGGVKTGAKTLGQEKMMASQAQGPVEDLYECVTDFGTNVEGKMAWYMMSNPFIRIPMIKEVPGVEGGLSLVYTNETRDGDFLDFNFEMVPYSTQGKTPQVAYQQLLSAVNQIVMPFMETAAQQGLVVDVQELTQTAAKYLESDDLSRVFRPADEEMLPPTDPGPYSQPLQGQNMKKPKNQGGQLDGRLGVKGDPGAAENAEQRNDKQESTSAAI